MNQDVKYDFTADLTRTGDRSVYVKHSFTLVVFRNDIDKEVCTPASDKTR